MLDIVTSYHCMQFQEKRMIRNQLNGKETHFGPDLGLLGPPGLLTVTRHHDQSLDIMVSYHHAQQKKLMIQS